MHPTRLIPAILTSLLLAVTAVFAGDARIGIRDPLVADRTYYVRTDGNDTNDGLTNDGVGAFLTIQKAIDVVADNLDLASNNVTIQVGDGTYGNINLKPYLGSGMVTINGNPVTPANVIITTAAPNTDAISSYYTLGSKWRISNLSVSTSGLAGNAISVGTASLNISNLRFLSAIQSHIVVQNGGFVLINSNYTIAGGATLHFFAQQNGTITVAPSTGTITVTLIGTPAFSTAFAQIATGSILRSYASQVSYIGNATGKRYNVNTNAVIFTLGGANYLPGDLTGTASTGGQYQ